MESWRQIRKQLRSAPVAEGRIAGATPLYAERYVLHGIDRPVRGCDFVSISIQFGGGRVREGEANQWRSNSLPSQALLVPPECPTHWHYDGAVDFGNFYFIEPARGMAERFLLLARSAAEPIQFTDSLVDATALQIFNEMHKGSSAEARFVEKLTEIMLEQAYRVLTTPETGGLSPRHIHFVRLQKVLTYIRADLAQDLSAGTLAKLAGVSLTHFRRIFYNALNVPVHQYVQAARLERARMLLGTTTLPITRIAEASGFSSQSHLTACFRATHAATPAEYRRQVSHDG